jgi:hypothetical protein
MAGTVLYLRRRRLMLVDVSWWWVMWSVPDLYWTLIFRGSKVKDDHLHHPRIAAKSTGSGANLDTRVHKKGHSGLCCCC